MKTKKILIQITSITMLGLLALFSLNAQDKPIVESASNPQGWKLIWNDEFDAPAVNEKIWRLAEGGGGWGNGELQKYTNLPENIRTENGNLVIEAIKTSNGYTSARMHSRFGFNFTFGRVESRMKIPQTQAIWPAFWMMGDTNDKTWPSCGEIDIMESIGKEPRTIHGTVHGPGYSGGKGITKAYQISDSLSDNWHLVGIEWDINEIRWYMDGTLYQTLNAKDLAGKKWVFDHDFYFIINLAVGGKWPDYPDATSVFPQQFIIDYVRVFQRK